MQTAEGGGDRRLEERENACLDRTMAKHTKRQKKKQLKKEYAALLSHYHLLAGLRLLSNARLRQFLDAVQYQRDNPTSGEDMLRTIRRSLCQSRHLVPKARMLWDADREVDLYAWAPFQLFFCVAWAVIDRYRHLKRLHPELAFSDLDQYLNAHHAGLDATRTLRNWVLHPGYARLPDNAMEMLFAAGGAPGNTYPQEMVNRLVALVAGFLEHLNGQIHH